MSIDKDDFNNLKVKIKEVTETAIELDNRQKRIIQTAQSINVTLKNGIDADISRKKAYEESQNKIKFLRNHIDISTKAIAVITEKIKKLQERAKPE